MPFPSVAADFETLFEPTRILLFGKLFPTIQYDRKTMMGVGDAMGGEGRCCQSCQRVSKI